MYYSGAPFAFKENKNVRSLLAYISKKGFSVGDKLPPGARAAEQLGISRNSLREALKVLERWTLWRSATAAAFSFGRKIRSRRRQLPLADDPQGRDTEHPHRARSAGSQGDRSYPRGGLPPSPGRDESVHRRRAQNGHDERGHAPPRPGIPQHHPPRRQQRHSFEHLHHTDRHDLRRAPGAFHPHELCGAVALGAQPDRQRLRLARRQSGQAGVHRHLATTRSSIERPSRKPDRPVRPVFIQ